MIKKNSVKNKVDTTSLIGYVAILVIILSLANIGVRLTGRVADTGVVNVTIESRTNINFSVSSVNFGTGFFDSGKTNATVDTLGNVINGNWTAVTEGFMVENVGTVNVTLDLKTNKNAVAFLGGTGPTYRYNVSNNKADSCIAGEITLGQWNDVNTTSPGTRICNILGYENTMDVIRIDLELFFSSDISSGNKTDTFTATATTI